MPLHSPALDHPYHLDYQGHHLDHRDHLEYRCHHNHPDHPDHLDLIFINFCIALQMKP